MTSILEIAPPGSGRGGESSSPDFFNIRAREYGAEGRGSADDSGAFGAAVAAALLAGGGIVYLPPGIYKFSGIVPILLVANLAGTLIIRGAGIGATIVRLSSTITSLLSTPSNRVNDTFGNVQIEDLTIDNNNVISGSHGILFNFNNIAANFDNLSARRIRTINGGEMGNGSRAVSINVTRRDPFGVFAGTRLASALETTGVTVIPFVSSAEMVAGMTFTLDTEANAEVLTVQSISGNNVTVEAPGTTRTHLSDVTISPTAVAQSTITNIVFDECDLGVGSANSATGGGATGIFISGFCNPSQSDKDNQYFNQTKTSANVLIDYISLNKVRWRSTVDPRAPSASAGIQIGGDAELRTVILNGCWIRGAGDVGYEIDACSNLIMKDCYAENCWNENIFIANNHGGIVSPQQQIQRLSNCTSVISNNNTLTAGFMASSLHGTHFGQIIFDRCIYKHTSARFTNGAETRESNPSNGGFYVVGQWSNASFNDCSVIFDRLALVSTESNLTQSPPGIVIQQMGGTATVEVKNFKYRMIGSTDAREFTGGSLQPDAIKIDFASRLTLIVDGVIIRSNMIRLNSQPFRLREVNFSLGEQTMRENWRTASTLSTQYILDEGTLSDLRQEEGVVRSVANHTVRKRFRVWNMLATSGAPKNQIGRMMDSCFYIQGNAPSGGPTNYELTIPIRVSTDGLTYAQAILRDDGANSSIRFEKVSNGGAPTIVAGPTNLTRITNGQLVGLRCKNQADIFTIDYFSSPAREPRPTEVGTTTLTYTLSAEEARTWGREGVPGYLGFGVTPADETGTVTLLRIDRLHVLSGSVDRLLPGGNEVVPTVTNALVFGSNSTNMRFENKLRCSGWGRGATAKDNATDINGGDSTQKSQLVISRSTLAAPTLISTVTLGGSAVATQISDFFDGWINIAGGTVSLIEWSPDGTNFFTIGVTTGMTFTIRNGDWIRVTYAVAPTVKKIINI